MRAKKEVLHYKMFDDEPNVEKICHRRTKGGATSDWARVTCPSCLEHAPKPTDVVACAFCGTECSLNIYDFKAHPHHAQRCADCKKAACEEHRVNAYPSRCIDCARQYFDAPGRRLRIMAYEVKIYDVPADLEEAVRAHFESDDPNRTLEDVFKNIEEHLDSSIGSYKLLKGPRETAAERLLDRVLDRIETPSRYR